MRETFSRFNVFDHLKTVEDCHAYIVESHHAMDEQRAEITRLRAELSHAITLSPETFHRFIEIWENPPPPTEALKALIRYNSHLLKGDYELRIDRLEAAIECALRQLADGMPIGATATLCAALGEKA